MKPGTRYVGERAYSVWERLWTRPALTVIALEAHPFAGSSNQVIDSARARLSLRTVPRMDERKAGALLVRRLTARPPSGARDHGHGQRHRALVDHRSRGPGVRGGPSRARAQATAGRPR